LPVLPLTSVQDSITMIKRLNSSDASFWQDLDALLVWESVSDKAVNDTVTGIIADIRSRGRAGGIHQPF